MFSCFANSFHFTVPCWVIIAQHMVVPLSYDLLGGFVDNHSTETTCIQQQERKKLMRRRRSMFVLILLALLLHMNENERQKEKPSSMIGARAINIISLHYFVQQERKINEKKKVDVCFDIISIIIAHERM